MGSQLTLDDALAARMPAPGKRKATKKPKAAKPGPADVMAAGLAEQDAGAADYARRHTPIVAPPSTLTLEQVAAHEAEIRRCAAIDDVAERVGQLTRLPSPLPYIGARNAWRASLLGVLAVRFNMLRADGEDRLYSFCDKTFVPEAGPVKLRPGESHHELHGFGEQHPRGAAVYAFVEAERTASRDGREPGYLLPVDARYRVVHVVSRWRGGEVRGYILHDGVARLRWPAHPETWPEVDAAVAAALCVRVDATRPVR